MYKIHLILQCFKAYSVIWISFTSACFGLLNLGLKTYRRQEIGCYLILHRSWDRTLYRPMFNKSFWIKVTVMSTRCPTMYEGPCKEVVKCAKCCLSEFALKVMDWLVSDTQLPIWCLGTTLYLIKWSETSIRLNN